jgi:hypothetical protein
LEHAPGNAHHTLVFADPDAELDYAALGIASGIGRKRKNMHLLRMFA